MNEYKLIDKQTYAQVVKLLEQIPAIKIYHDFVISQTITDEALQPAETKKQEVK